MDMEVEEASRSYASLVLARALSRAWARVHPESMICQMAIRFELGQVLHVRLPKKDSIRPRF